MSVISSLSDRFKAEVSGRIIAAISSAILITSLARLLEPDSYGLLFLAISVFAVVEVFSNIGISKSAARYLAEYKETKPAQIPNIIRFSFATTVLTIAVVCIIFLLTHRYIPIWLGEPDLTPFLMVGILFIIFGTLETYTRKIFQGLEQIKISATLHAMENISKVIIALGLVLFGYGAIGALVGHIVAFAIASISGLLLLYFRHYRDEQEQKRESGLYRRIIEYNIPLTATRAATILDKRVDTILVGFFIGPVAVAYYTLGTQIISFVKSPALALGFTLAPTYQAQKEQGNEELSAQIYEQAMLHSLVLYLPAAAGLILTAPFVIDLVFGERYIGAVPVLQILSIYAVLQAVETVTSHGLDFLGRARERAIALGVTAVLNVGLNIILISILGVVGAAIATVITYTIYTVTNIYIMWTELNIRTYWLVKKFAVICLITIVMSIGVYTTVDFITGFITLFIVVGFGAIIWLILILISGVIDIRRLISILL